MKRFSARGITYFGAAINLVVGALKIAAGIVFNSKALVVDGLHSLVDLSTDLAVLLGLRFAQLPKDHNHPYGHHKIGSLIQLLIALVIFFFSASLMINALFDFQQPRAFQPTLGALVVAIVGLVSKEILFWMTRAVAKRERSRLLMTNAWHHRTDSISSVLTVIAIGSILFAGPEWLFLDSLMAVGLGLFLAIEGIRLSIQALNDLMDRAPDQELLDDLREHILPTDGVLGYHDFRARRIGDMVEVDLHLQVDPRISVEMGHEIARKVRKNVMETHHEVIDVLVHIEPANNESLDITRGLAGKSDTLAD